MTEYWLAIAPFDICEAARRENFCQFGRGHMAPAVRMKLGDGVVLMGRSRGAAAASETLYALGTVDEGDAYAVPDQGREIWRRDVLWWPAEPTPLSTGARFGRPVPSFATVRGSARLSAAEFVQLARTLDLDLELPFLVAAQEAAEPVPVLVDDDPRPTVRRLGRR